jgi:hypothetical protein
MIIEYVEASVDNGRSIIIAWTNVAIMCGAKLYHICIGHECVYQVQGYLKRPQRFMNTSSKVIEFQISLVSSLVDMYSRMHT